MLDPWDEVRALLPGWVGWSGLVYPLFAGLWVWLSSRACSAIALRRSCKLLGTSPKAELHWTERARLWHAARQAARGNLVAFTIVVAVVVILRDSPVQRVSPALSGTLAYLAAAVSGWCVWFVQERRIRPLLDWRTAAAGVLTMGLVMFPHLFIGVLAVAQLPQQIEARNAWAFGLVFALLLGSVSGAGLWLARAIGVARPANERIQRAVAHAAEQQGHTPRGVYVLPLSYANAFAFPLLNSVAFTTLAERTLSDEELSSIAAHEIGHLREPTWFQLARAAVALALVGPFAFTGVVVHNYGIGALIGLTGAVVIVSALWRRVSRRMEARADQAGHESPAYARALERVYAENLAPAVMHGAGTTHPHLYDRMSAAGATPEFARPAPPPRVRLGGIALLLSTFTFVLAPYAVYLLDGEDDQTLYLQLALHHAPSWELSELARRRKEDGALEQAVVFYRGAHTATPSEFFYFWSLATTLHELGRTQEARALLDQQLALQPPAAYPRRPLELLKTILETPQPTAFRSPSASDE